MELSRNEYPALLASLQPGQAVAVLNERVKHVGKLNADIADWLQERRKVEDLYVQGLRKLARRQPPDESSELGIFAAPWQSIVSSTESLAESHYVLAQKIESDVERPLRQFTSSSRELQAMGTIQGNLAAIAKEVESAQKRADKLQGKGAKAAAGKVANATSEVDNANSQWESQAPFVFEKLQAVDESRLNHLREVLTQLQTHEVDQVERNRITAEQCLNTLLSVETADEIKGFSQRVAQGRPKVERQRSRNAPSFVVSQPASAFTPDDRGSQISDSVQEQRHGGLTGLKRLGTVLGRRRQSIYPYGRAPSPERKSSSNLGHTLGSFSGRLTRSKDSSNTIPTRAERRQSLPPVRREESTPEDVSTALVANSTQDSGQIAPERNDELTSEPTNTLPNSGLVNGAHEPGTSQLQNSLRPDSQSGAISETQTDSEGYTVRQTGSDIISQAEQEAASETTVPQFKVDIRTAPIEEEDGDAETALANVANALRAQATPTRRLGTTRGRRDVRNTMFVPSPEPAAAATFPIPFSIPPAVASSPTLKPGHRNVLSEEHAASDTQSVRSGRSLSSLASATIRHAELIQPGLNSSIVETLSVWMHDGHITKTVLIGEVALAYNPVDISVPFGTENIRLGNFQVLEKVAPNPTFIEQTPNAAGEYMVNLASITKRSVAFKYQVHLEDSEFATHAPLILSPAWKVEPTQASVILSFSLNPAFMSGSQASVTLSNLVIIVHLDDAKATTCQSKPVGTFSRERSLIYWRLGDVTLEPHRSPEQLRARFYTHSEAKPGRVEARWEMSGDKSIGLGSGLGVSQLNRTERGKEPQIEASNPFEDEGATPTPALTWKPVATVRKIISGTYFGT